MDGRGENHRGSNKKQKDVGHSHAPNNAREFNDQYQASEQVRRHNELNMGNNPVKALVGRHNLHRSLYVTFSTDEAEADTTQLATQMKQYFNREFGQGTAERVHLDMKGLNGWVVLKEESLIHGIIGQHYVGNVSVVASRVRGY